MPTLTKNKKQQNQFELLDEVPDISNNTKNSETYSQIVKNKTSKRNIVLLVPDSINCASLSKPPGLTTPPGLFEHQSLNSANSLSIEEIEINTDDIIIRQFIEEFCSEESDDNDSFAELENIKRQKSNHDNSYNDPKLFSTINQTKPATISDFINLLRQSFFNDEIIKPLSQLNNLITNNSQIRNSLMIYDYEISTMDILIKFIGSENQVTNYNNLQTMNYNNLQNANEVIKIASLIAKGYGKNIFFVNIDSFQNNNQEQLLLNEYVSSTINKIVEQGKHNLIRKNNDIKFDYTVSTILERLSIFKYNCDNYEKFANCIKYIVKFKQSDKISITEFKENILTIVESKLIHLYFELELLKCENKCITWREFSKINDEAHKKFTLLKFENITNEVFHHISEITKSPPSLTTEENEDYIRVISQMSNSLIMSQYRIVQEQNNSFKNELKKIMDRIG